MPMRTATSIDAAIRMSVYGSWLEEHVQDGLGRSERPAHVSLEQGDGVGRGSLKHGLVEPERLP